MMNFAAGYSNVGRRPCWLEVLGEVKFPVNGAGNFTPNQRSFRGRLTLSNKAMPTATAIPP
jgi:hypothetical protein